MGKKMFQFATLLCQHKDESIGIPIEEFIEKADRFARVFPAQVQDGKEIAREEAYLLSDWSWRL